MDYLTCMHLSFPICEMNGGTVHLGSLAAQPEASDDTSVRAYRAVIPWRSGPFLPPTLCLRMSLGWREGRKKQEPGSHYKPSAKKKKKKTIYLQSRSPRGRKASQAWGGHLPWRERKVKVPQQPQRASRMCELGVSGVGKEIWDQRSLNCPERVFV